MFCTSVFRFAFYCRQLIKFRHVYHIRCGRRPAVRPFCMDGLVSSLGQYGTAATWRPASELQCNDQVTASTNHFNKNDAVNQGCPALRWIKSPSSKTLLNVLNYKTTLSQLQKSDSIGWVNDCVWWSGKSMKWNGLVIFLPRLSRDLRLKYGSSRKRCRYALHSTATFVGRGFINNSPAVSPSLRRYWLVYLLQVAKERIFVSKWEEER